MPSFPLFSHFLGFKAALNQGVIGCCHHSGVLGTPSIAVWLLAARAGTCQAPFLAMTCLLGGTGQACFPLSAPHHSSGQAQQWEMLNLASCLPQPWLGTACRSWSGKRVLQKWGATKIGGHLCSYLSFPMKFSPPRDRSVGSMEMR